MDDDTTTPPDSTQGAGPLPPASWPVYFPGVEHDAADRRAALVDGLLRALGGDEGWRLVRRARAHHGGEYALPLDYEELLAAAASARGGGCEADLEAAVELAPLEALACIGAAVHEVRAVCLF